MNKKTSKRVEITSLKLGLAYDSPFGELEVLQTPFKEEITLGQVSITRIHDEGISVSVPWLSSMINRTSISKAVQDFQKAVAWWSGQDAPQIFREGILPPIDAQELMSQAYPTLVQELELIADKTYSMALSDSSAKQQQDRVRSLPDGTPLLEVGTLADFDPDSDDEKTQCVALMRLINRDGRFALERGDGGEVDSIFETDALEILDDPQLATQANAAALIAELGEPKIHSVLFAKDSDFDTELVQQAEKLLAQSTSSTAVAPARPSIHPPSLEEWLNGIV